MKPEKVKTTGRLWVQCLFISILLLIIPFWMLLSADVNIDNYIGLNYVTNYKSPPHQNWCIVQDKRGIIYVANQGVLLEFDGITWRELEIPNDRVRSVALDDNGIVYVGGHNEIGFLEPKPRATLKYKSLMDQLKDHQKNFSTIRRINVTKEGVYFRAKQYLFRWDAKSRQMKTWTPESDEVRFDDSFTCNGKLFIHQRGVGLMKMVNDSLKMVRGNETFASVKIYMMVPYNEQKLLIGTREKGFYLYDGVKAVLFPTDVDDYLTKKELYKGIRISTGDYALATQQGGVVIINSQGKVKKIFNKASGLQDECVNYVFEDFQGNLWLAADKGISKIEYGSPVSIYDENRSDLLGLVYSVVRHGPNNNLYVGTARGLFYLASPSSVKFRRVSKITQGCFYLLSIDDSLLAATDGGVFQVRNNIEKRKVIEESSLSLHLSQTNPNRIWVGTKVGLVSIIYRENGQWTKESQFEKITGEIRNIVEDQEGNLWFGLVTEGVSKVDFQVKERILPYVVTTYDTSYKLPKGAVRVFSAAGNIMFGTDKGVYRFDEKDKVFLSETKLGDEFAGDESVDDDSRCLWRIAEDKNKNIWFHSQNKNFKTIIQPDGTSRTSILRIPSVVLKTIYPDPDGKTIWFGCDTCLIGFDTTVAKDFKPDFSVVIREVMVNGRPLLYDSKKNTYKTVNDFNNPFPIFPYKDRNLRFEFAALFFEAETETQYQCFLEGYDEGWSAWSLDRKRDYTNLDSGVYQFHVQAKTAYEDLSKEAVFKFKVLPPWYKTWWALSIYAFAVILMVFLIVNWRSWRLEQEKQRLEQVVKNRTKEINHKNRQLEEQSEKLKEMDKVKSRFFANISHEFRTPLTLIMGPLEQLLSNCQDREIERKMNLMLRNSQRLLNLINQLLDLSKFDSGRMKLRAVRQNIVPFLKNMKDSFELAAQQHEVDLTFHTKKENIILYFDTEKMENVMCNLLINAIKFTPPGGKVTVTVTVSSPDFLEISIRDTGIGIHREQLEYIFDRFFQAEEPSRAHHLKGTGIGLALTKELVNLHHGRLDVHSRVGDPSGTEFIIQLPMGKEHLKLGEVIESVEGEVPTTCKIPSSMLIEEEKCEIETKETMDIVEPVEDRADEKDIILVVEDGADVREYIRGSLESIYTVVEAKDGEEGINKAKEIIPDLIISDVMMPGIDGFELCRVLKKDVLTSHIPVILLTAKAADEDVLEGLETGADDYITKPFNTKILCARIKNLIDLRRQLQQNLNREMTLQPVKTSVSEVDKEFFKDMHKVIEKNLSESDFNVEQMGKKLYMSRATLYRKIMALTGETPTEYIRTYRLKRGAELLKSNYGTVLEVALEVGFSSSAYFTKCFKEKFHQLPSEFQASEGQ